MRGYYCCRCESDNMVFHEVIWRNGTTHSTYETSSRSIHTSMYNEVSFGRTDHQTSGTAQTALAAECAPPVAPPTGMGIVALVGWAAGAAFIYWKFCDWRGDGFDKLVVGAGAVAALLAVVDVVTMEKAAERYAAQMEEYNRTCVCMQCGTHNVLPQGWDQNNGEEETA